MSFWERIKAFFEAEEEDRPRTSPLDEWGKHELTIKSLEFITQVVSQRCALAQNRRISSGSRSGFAIDIYSYRIEIGTHGEDGTSYAQVFFEKFGYDRLGENQTILFSKAIYKKLLEIYASDPKIKLEYSYVSSWDKYGCIFVDITDYHPRLKQVQL